MIFTIIIIFYPIITLKKRENEKEKTETCRIDSSTDPAPNSSGRGLSCPGGQRLLCRW